MAKQSAPTRKTNVKRNAKAYALGVDYGTNSVRALIVDAADGNEIAEAVFDYPSGQAGILLDPKDPNLARQHPGDYITGFHKAVKAALKAAASKRGFAPDRIVGIGVDTTGSSPLPVDRDGVALGTKPQFKNNLAAQCWLWKDHTAHAEAAEITEKAARHPDGYLDKCGGTYSSEWYWSKALKCRRVAPKVFKAAYAWVECCDYITGYLTGNTDPHTMPRSICAAGHKAMYHPDWGGLPAAGFLKSLHPDLVKFREHYDAFAFPSDQLAGHLRVDVAKQAGLPAGLPVAVGAFDAHMGAVGSGIKPGTLVKIMGTSTCDIMVAPLQDQLPDIPGLCGIVPESVLPGMYGLEAGQSAVGDIFNWFVNTHTPGKYGTGGAAHAALTNEAAKLKPGASGLVALDWNNGNRTVLVDPRLTGLIVGQTLHTTAAETYRALVEATAFGALTIINRIEQYGVPVKEVVNCGGISEKNAMVMQIYADVCNRPMKISRSAQTCALGAAIFGGVVGGAYPSVAAAQKKMTGTKPTVFRPKKANAATYAELYKLYTQLHDALGTTDDQAKLDNVMKDLIAIREKART